MNLIDSHCHLDLACFDADREEVVARSRAAGVTQWVVPGIQRGGFEGLCALCAEEEGCHPALGYHPLFLPDDIDHDMAQLALWCRRENPCAIGEIGLDFIAPPATHDAQRTLFDAQLKLAETMGLPVLLHVRKAHDEVLLRLKRLGFSRGGIVHAYGGSLPQAERYLAMGFKMGFGGVVTRPNARRIRNVARELPDEALVLETDAPDLPPVDHLKERNEPGYLPQVAQALAELRGVSVDQIAAITRDNTRHILGI